MLKAVLVDDEFPAREELKWILLEIGKFEIVGECGGGDEALDILKNSAADVIFLDIQMYDRDGLSTAWEILQMPKPPKIVFATGYSEYAVKAFELNAVDYIMKPYSKQRLEATFRKIASQGQQGNRQVFEMIAAQKSKESVKLSVWSNDRLIVLQPAEILYVKAEGKRQTMIQTLRGSFFTSHTLRDIEERLKNANFCRTHKSYLVNLDSVREIVPWFNHTYRLVLEKYHAEEIPVGGAYIKNFNKIMGI